MVLLFAFRIVYVIINIDCHFVLLWSFLVSIVQSVLQSAKHELDKQRSALRERNKEIQKYEQERHKREKEKVECGLKMKELEHKISKFNKDSRDAGQRVSVTLT